MKEIIAAIQKAGVVGAGGAGFPTHVKLDAKADYVLVNGAECEPLLRVDQILMRDEPEKILFALQAAVAAVGAKEGVIALKGKYVDAMDALSRHLADYPKIRIHTLDNIYPAGDEHYIVHDVTGRIVPEGGIPLDVGCVVVNVETLYNVFEGLHGHPVTEKYVTIAGHVREPKTLKVPVGTSLRTLIELAGGTPLTEYRVIDGGPMMGKVLPGADTPVKKTSKGYIVLPADHGLITSKLRDINTELKEARTSCCHCDLCTDVCPRYLLGHNLHPSKIMRIASYGHMGENASVDQAYLCCECGLCEQACIMNLQPWKVNIFLKGKLKEQGVKNSNRRTELTVHPYLRERSFPQKKLLYRLDLYGLDHPADYAGRVSLVDRVEIPQRHHIGALGTLMVSEGDWVQKGDLLYGAEEPMAVNVHASIDGRVSLGKGRVIITKEENIHETRNRTL